MNRLEFIIDTLLIVLAFALCFRIFPSVNPLIEIATASNSPKELHQPDAAKTILPVRLQTVGQYVTVEDLIRYLEHHPEIVEKDKQVVALLQRMIDRQSQLLKTEENILSIEKVLNETAFQLYSELSDSEKQLIRQQRNVNSVEDVEAVYWNSLLNKLESQ